MADETMPADPASEIDAQIRQMAEEALNQGVAFLLGYAPGVSVEDAQALVAYQMQIQHELEPVLRDVISEASRASHPEWGFAIVQKTETGETIVSRGRVPKTLPKGEPMPLPLLNSVATIVGLLSFPPLRALAGAYGLEVRFQQAKRAPVSPIIVP